MKVSVPEVLVSRWARFGHDRLYVEIDGIKCGYRDLKTGLDVPASPDQAQVLKDACDRWQAQSATPTPMAVTSPADPADDVSAPALSEEAAPEWMDLAQHLPGQAARLQADLEWDKRRSERPVRAVIGRVLNLKTEERAWRIGADGEARVAASLAKVAERDPRWRFLHAVPVGVNGADIDHLIIGPAGVFTVNAKHHPGAKIWVGGDTFMVNGQRHPYIRNSRHEALRASRLLTRALGTEVKASGVIVTVRAETLTIKTQPDDVTIVERRHLRRWLQKRPETLGDDRIAAIFALARRSSTWSG